MQPDLGPAGGTSSGAARAEAVRAGVPAAARPTKTRRRAADDPKRGGRAQSDRPIPRAARLRRRHRCGRAAASASTTGKCAAPHSGRGAGRARGWRRCARATRSDPPSAAPHAPAAGPALAGSPRTVISRFACNTRSPACRPKWVATTRSIRSPIIMSASTALRGAWPETVRSTVRAESTGNRVRIALQTRLGRS